MKSKPEHDPNSKKTSAPKKVGRTPEAQHQFDPKGHNRNTPLDSSLNKDVTKDTDHGEL